MKCLNCPDTAAEGKLFCPRCLPAEAIAFREGAGLSVNPDRPAPPTPTPVGEGAVTREGDVVSIRVSYGIGNVRIGMTPAQALRLARSLLEAAGV